MSLFITSNELYEESLQKYRLCIITFMLRFTIRGQKEKEKEKQQQKEKAFNPNIENNSEIEDQSQIQKIKDVKEIMEFWDNNGFSQT